MTKYIVIAIGVAILAYIAYWILSQINFNKCKSCNGLGYWEGTRGEKNACKTCGGSGSPS